MRRPISPIEVLTSEQVKKSPYEGLKRILAAEDTGRDLMYVRFILCHEGPNDNGDYFFREELEQAYETIRNKPINWEHGLPIIGVVTDSILVRPEGARWHIECAGVIWRYLFTDEAEAIRRSAMERHLCISMECYYKSVWYVVDDGLVPEEEAPELEEYVGRMRDGRIVYRGLRGVLFGGCGVVRRPADKEAVFLAVAKRLSQTESPDIIFPDWAEDFYEFLRFGERNHMDTSTWGKTNFGHRLLHMWWKNPEKTYWGRDDIIDEHISVVRAMIEKYHKNHNMTDGLDDTLPQGLKDKSGKEGSRMEIAEIRDIPDEELTKNLASPETEATISEVDVAEIQDDDSSKEASAPEPNEEPIVTSSVESSEEQMCAEAIAANAEVVCSTEEEPTGEVPGGGDPETPLEEVEEEPAEEESDPRTGVENNPSGASLEVELATSRAAYAELEARYAELEKAFAAVKREFEEFKAEIARKELDAKLDLVADMRMRELAGSGARFSTDRAEKVRARLRGMTDEEFADYKAEVLELVARRSDEEPSEFDVVAAMNPELQEEEAKNPYVAFAQDIVGALTQRTRGGKESSCLERRSKVS